MVGVTEPELCGLFVPNEDQVASVLAEHARRCSLSVPQMIRVSLAMKSPRLSRPFGVGEAALPVSVEAKGLVDDGGSHGGWDGSVGDQPAVEERSGEQVD